MTIEYTPEAIKELSKLDKQAARQIKDYMDEVEKLKDPRERGKALKGTLSEYWRYRSGNYRIICKIEDKKLIVTVLKVADRKEAYK